MKLVFVVVICIMAGCVSVAAQSICPIKTLRVDSIKGKVIFNDRVGEPVRNTKVELWQIGESDHLITSSRTNADGLFEIEKPKKSRYRLGIWMTIRGQQDFRYDIALDVRSGGKNGKPSYIKVKLGLDCFNSEATVIKNKGTEVFR